MVRHMRESGLLTLGAFILGLGLGWYVFGLISLAYQMFAWTLIILGAAIVLSALFSRWHPSVRGLIGAFAGGLVLSLFLTSGLGFTWDILPGGSWPYSVKVRSRTVDL
ncbi:MAG: hypothetical protein QW587_09695 [Candidatus Bathyarchaeia archaeon]